MSKLVALCCIFLCPTVCHATCAPGTDTCNVMDEAALIQKDLALMQKNFLEQPADIDRQTAAKHISETLSLQYLSQAANAKLEMAKQLLEEFNPLGDAALAATNKYEASKHSKADFEAWYDAVSGSLGKAVSSITSVQKVADAEAVELKTHLTKSLDKMEDEDSYCDLVTKYMVASQKSQQGSMFANTAKEQNDIVLKKLEKFDEKSQGGFKKEVFGKTLTAINVAVTTLKNSLQAFVTINENKAKEVHDASLKFKSHTPESCDAAITQLIAEDKHVARTALAKQFQDLFMPQDGEISQSLMSYSQHKGSKQAFDAFQSTVMKAFDGTLTQMKKLNEANNRAESELKTALLASFDNLADEENLVGKLLSFGTAWGKRRLEADITAPLSEETAKLRAAFKAYAEAKDDEQDKAFGTVYQQVITSLITVKSVLSQWVEVQKQKITDIKEEDPKLQPFALLLQKGLEEPADIHAPTVAQHLSEALSLQYLTQSNEAKLEQAKKLRDEFKPIGDEILAATTKYKASKHSEEDFEAWYDAVSEGFGKIVTSVGSESKTADAEVTQNKKDLDFYFDRMEEAENYADLVTKLAVATQRRDQANFFATTAKEQNDKVLEAMEAYEQKNAKWLRGQEVWQDVWCHQRCYDGH
eukprot:gnl/TRDRNA2_/TRDRNA2_174537_c1_seq1.p1 gnl/TRDRNA2_/TRDRNA2_174537_c1~~gnl/TRDRNA2_/TRDRNA2_174537_c1_seq1.p1  ORF type:complete len:643 (+),score=209.50 gnl/TRDRNA2_/TRDRNA2_174537_c1_seq1:76-2004(+)